jgi:copper oxidase (laccase) domain-containing protein
LREEYDHVCAARATEVDEKAELENKYQELQKNLVAMKQLHNHVVFDLDAESSRSKERTED